MSNSNYGYLHFTKRKRMSKGLFRKSDEEIKTLFDKIIYFAIFFGFLMNLPQLLQIYINKNASGVSSVSWIGFMFVSMIWFAYGMIHNDKVIITNSFFLIIMQGLIAIGSLIY